jgi:dipeptidyl aminopeptidase/acylaminoacyl peptidase
VGHWRPDGAEKGTLLLFPGRTEYIEKYGAAAQDLANRGYAVMQPNFRGSTGYGREFMTKGFGQMGLAMQDDVTDGMNYLAEQGIIDPKRVCIIGASYGGYSAMWGVVKDPDLYRCSISIAGVSNVRRDVNAFGGTVLSRTFSAQWKKMSSDFKSISPVNFVDQITVPMLLIHGKRDDSVDYKQSTRMEKKMRDAGKDVEMLILPEADHYFLRQDDRIALLTAMEGFLKKHNPPD